jgi:hypothetical protein
MYYLSTTLFSCSLSTTLLIYPAFSPHHFHQHPRTLLLIQNLSFHLTLNPLLTHRRPKPTIQARIRIPRPRAPRHRLPPIRRPRIHRLRILPRARIDPNIDRGVQAIRNRFTDEADLHNGVVAALLAHVEERVGGVEGLRLRVGVVGRGLFDLREEVLLDVELADV